MTAEDLESAHMPPSTSHSSWTSGSISYCFHLCLLYSGRTSSTLPILLKLFLFIILTIISVYVCRHAWRSDDNLGTGSVFHRGYQWSNSGSRLLYLVWGISLTQHTGSSLPPDWGYLTSGLLHLLISLPGVSSLDFPVTTSPSRSPFRCHLVSDIRSPSQNLQHTHYFLFPSWCCILPSFISSVCSFSHYNANQHVLHLKTFVYLIHVYYSQCLDGQNRPSSNVYLITHPDSLRAYARPQKHAAIPSM